MLMIYDNVAVIEQVYMVEELMGVQAANLAFYQEQIPLDQKEIVEGKMKELLHREINSVEELEQWLQDESRLSEQLNEAISGVYIAFNRYNNDEAIKKKYEYQQQEIMPLLKKYNAELDKKFYNSPYREQLDQQVYGPLIRSRVNSIELFREENIAIEVEENKLENQYFEITGSMTIEWEGEEKTIPQMRVYLQDTDRAVREKAWRAVWEEISKHQESLQEIMNQLIKLRHQKALNAGFENYRDYMFKRYERFDYTPEDCFQFHDAVEKHVVPLVKELNLKQQQELGLDTLRPWDTQATKKGEEPLKPFQTADELVAGTKYIFEKLDPAFAQMLEDMDQKDLLDLESRKAKSPGGFCSSLPVTGLSFVFMNATGTQSDLSTMVHEGGHCVHNLLAKDQHLAGYKSAPMESAELASMSMELFTIDMWDQFYKDPKQLKRAQREHVEGIISFFPWAMVVDKFQHWIYENPEHTVAEREAKFEELINRFIYQGIDKAGLEDYVKLRWLMQLHIFEVPFYYIEYAIAQLGALQMWKAYEENPEQTISSYKDALAKGSSIGLPDVYATAGIKFDFSSDMINEMMEFAQQKLQSYEQK